MVLWVFCICSRLRSCFQHAPLRPRAQSYAERLRLGLAVLHGEANGFDTEMADGPQSPPLQRPTTAHTGLELPCKNSALSKLMP